MYRAIPAIYGKATTHTHPELKYYENTNYDCTLEFPSVLHIW